MGQNTPTPPLRVLLIDADRGRAAILEQALADAGHQVVARLDSSGRLSERVRQCEPDVIIIDLESPDRDTLENMRAVSRDHPRPIVMFTEDPHSDSINQAIQAGVSAYVVDGLSPARVKPLMDVAIARFREYQALRSELDKAKHSLEERKLIDRAKRLLINQRGMDETRAYQTLRKLAMDRGQKMVTVARDVIAIFELID